MGQGVPPHIDPLRGRWEWEPGEGPGRHAGVVEGVEAGELAVQPRHRGRQEVDQHLGRGRGAGTRSERPSVGPLAGIMSSFGSHLLLIRGIIERRPGRWEGATSPQAREGGRAPWRERMASGSSTPVVAYSSARVVSGGAGAVPRVTTPHGGTDWVPV